MVEKRRATASSRLISGSLDHPVFTTLVMTRSCLRFWTRQPMGRVTTLKMFATRSALRKTEGFFGSLSQRALRGPPRHDHPNTYVYVRVLPSPTKRLTQAMARHSALFLPRTPVLTRDCGQQLRLIASRSSSLDRRPSKNDIPAAFTKPKTTMPPRVPSARVNVRSCSKSGPIYRQ